MEQLTRGMAKDYGRRHVTVNAVGPGPTDTCKHNFHGRFIFMEGLKGFDRRH